MRIARWSNAPHGRSASRLRDDEALNCLERVLILCNDLNPRIEMAGVDPRVRRAMAMIGERLSDPPSVTDLARAVGLSRSRFTALFTEAAGLPPRASSEEMRLTRAAQMLRLSAAAVGHVAEEVGLSRVGLANKIKRYGIDEQL